MTHKKLITLRFVAMTFEKIDDKLNEVESMTTEDTIYELVTAQWSEEKVMGVITCIATFRLIQNHKQ